MILRLLIIILITIGIIFIPYGIGRICFINEDYYNLGSHIAAFCMGAFICIVFAVIWFIVLQPLFSFAWKFIKYGKDLK